MLHRKKWWATEISKTSCAAIWKVLHYKNDTYQRPSKSKSCTCNERGGPDEVPPMLGLKDTENSVGISVSRMREISTFELETQPYVVARERAASTLRSAMPRYNACVRCDS
mmetsp:Transcript_3233/g.6281  ORF Transcript_3233/g.6281 Transcript_3233/m.6281 type:complete len:111 (-) Transcript_3233:351-683(-)